MTTTKNADPNITPRFPRSILNVSSECVPKTVTLSSTYSSAVAKQAPSPENSIAEAFIIEYGEENAISAFGHIRDVPHGVISDRDHAILTVVFSKLAAENGNSLDEEMILESVLSIMKVEV